MGQDAATRPEVVVPMTCGTEGCPRSGMLINAVAIPHTVVDAFYEAFGQGGEDEATDCCSVCGKLAYLEEPEDASPNAAPHLPTCFLVLQDDDCSCGHG